MLILESSNQTILCTHSQVFGCLEEKSKSKKLGLTGFLTICFLLAAGMPGRVVYDFGTLFQSNKSHSAIVPVGFACHSCS